MASVWTDLSGVGDGQDPYLMATFHHYDPWTFCGDNQGTYDDNWTDANLSGPMDTMLAWAQSTGKGMPVYIGEWGVGWGSRYTTMDCNNIRSWYQKMAENAQTKGIPTSLWDDNGWFKVWDIGSQVLEQQPGRLHRRDVRLERHRPLQRRLQVRAATPRRAGKRNAR